MTKSISRAALLGCASLLLANTAAAQAGPPRTEAAAASGRAYTVDDMLRAEAFGKGSIDPSERRVVFERFGAYEDAVRFDIGAFVRQTTSVLWVADLSGGEARRLLDPAEGQGLLIGAWSPSGDQLLVHRLRSDTWDAGVVDVATGSVRWLGLFPEVPALGRTFQWRSETELIAIHRPAGRLPDQAGAIPNAFEAVRRRQLAAATGRFSGTRLGAGAFAEAPLSEPNAVLSIDVRTGLRRTLATGRYFDLELSPDGRWVALLENGAMPAIDLSRPLRGLERPQSRRLRIVDLSTGEPVAVCEDCNAALGTLQWSPDSRRLLVWDRTAPDPLNGTLLVVVPSTGAVERQNLDGLIPDLDLQAGYLDVIKVGWLGDRPLIRARRAGGDRVDWWSLQESGPRNLTEGLPSSPGRLETVSHDEAQVIADGRIWRLTVDEGAVAISANAQTLVTYSEPDPLGAARLRLNTPGPGGDFVVRCRGGWLTGSQAPDCREAAPVVRRNPLAATPQTVLEVLPRGQGTRLDLRQGGVSRTLAVLNEDLDDIAFASPVAVPHPVPGGGVANSWLYLPPHRRTEPVPVVVIVYPGQARLPETDPSRVEAEANVQLLAAAGYAVLVASIPRPAVTADPAAGLGDQIVSVLDAVLAQHPELDGDRVALMGHSFGGYSALVTATQTHRFRSIIAAASISDLSANWGESSALNRADPANGPSRRHRAGQAETGPQTGLGGPPWFAPDRYVRNSPLFAADRITTPILLIHGDLDMIPLGQAELMFSALWRQNKDARLLTYWGEGHSIDNPANIRDLHHQELDWLARTLGSRHPGARVSSDAPIAGSMPPPPELD